MISRLHRWLAPLAVLFILAAFERPAWAYPWMIKHDYKACNTCHADPSGSGLLTQYGRGMEETLTHSYFGKHTGEEDPGKRGNFMFGAFDLPEWLLLQADGRGLNMIQPRAAEVYTFWLMQANAQAQITLGRFRAMGDVGLGAPGSALGSSVTRGDYRLISRQFWLGLDIGSDNQFLLRAGRINVPYGLRMIEHTAYVRRATRTDINSSQEYGATLAYTGEKIRGEVMGIFGNFQIRPDAYRERGYSAYLELAINDRFSLGGTSLITHANNDVQLATPLWRQAHGLFARWTPVKPIVVMAESDLLLFSQPPVGTSAATNSFGNASYLTVDIEPWQGLHFMPTAEFLFNKAAQASGFNIAGWASVAWFFAPHMDARLDAIFENKATGSATSSFSTTLLGQLHFLL